MKERYKLKCAVFLLLTKMEDNKEYILLQRRYNTGTHDGEYDVACSGHLEDNESISTAMKREAKEEIGIDLIDISLSSTMHANYSGNEYVYYVFKTTKYNDIPKIMEPNKCDELQWFDIYNLPTNIIDTRKIMIDNYLNNNIYSEYGFKKDSL